MTDKQPEVQELSITREGISLKSVAVNTILTLAIALGVGYMIFEIRVTTQALADHKIDAAQAGKAFVEAIKEQTIAIREGNNELKLQNCLTKFPESERKEQDTWCKQITGTR